MTYRKRVFLNPISEGAPSFIQAVAASSDSGTYSLGDYILIIADCNRRILIEFPLTNARLRNRSLAKIDRLAKVVNQFRDVLYREAKLIGKGSK